MSIDLQRSEGPPNGHRSRRRGQRVPRIKLPSKQRAVLDIVVQVYRATQEPCPARLIARRLNVAHPTVLEHLSALYRKGWLLTPSAPSVPTSH